MLNIEKRIKNVVVTDKYGIKDRLVSKQLICHEVSKIFKKTDNERQYFKQPLPAAVLGVHNTEAFFNSSSNKERKFVQTWTDIDEQDMFLRSKPTCYLILSKPGSSEYSLGEAMAKKLNCVHLCPRNVLIDEIKQNSHTGKCIDFNMRHNKVCRPDVIWSIIKGKILSPVIKHRGYILSGFPLVTSDRSPLYTISSLISEESLIIVADIIAQLVFDLTKKRKKDKLKMAKSDIDESDEEELEEEQQREGEEDGVEEEESKPVELPPFILEVCSDIIFSTRTYCDTLKSVLLRQIAKLFNLEMKPDVVIYVTCPDTDSVTKKFNKLFDFEKNTPTVRPFLSNMTSDLRWPSKYLLEAFSNDINIVDSDDKYYCRQPLNYISNSVDQICNYRKYIISFVEDQLKRFDPTNIIKLDGRTSIQEMLHNITERLDMMSVFKPVIIPELTFIEETEEEGELWKSIEETKIFPLETIPIFNRCASLFYMRCPVELSKRQSLIGKPRFAVSFLKHVYLLSSLNAVLSFYINPRQYLNLYNVEPTCRIVVMGTKTSGKTMVAHCLSWLFDAPIISFQEAYQQAEFEKYEALSQSIFSEIIFSIEDNRLSEWKKKEQERLDQIKQWQILTTDNLKKYVNYLKHSLSLDDEEDPETMNAIDNLKRQLMFLPFVDDLRKCEKLLKINNFNPYVPKTIAKALPRPEMPMIGDVDVTKAIDEYIVTNELENEIVPTLEEIIDKLITIISDIDNKAQQNSHIEGTYGKYIIDGMPPNVDPWEKLVNKQCLPDHAITIIENREIDDDLMRYYTKLETCTVKNYEERFLLAKDPLIQLKLQTKTGSATTELNMKMIVDELFNICIDTVLKIGNIDTEIDYSTEIGEFEQSIETFREEWESLKLLLEENKKNIIEVELENKSDIELVEDILLKLRKSYNESFTPNEEEDEVVQDEEEPPKDLMVDNDSNFLCETNIYCPIAYYNHGICWRGKTMYSAQFQNKIYYFCNAESISLFENDPCKYMYNAEPFKKLPVLRICVMGCIGSGKTTLSQKIAKELGLIHVDFEETMNEYLMPRHFKKVGRKHENSFAERSMDEDVVSEFQMGEESDVADILGNEFELRRMVFNYLEYGQPILSALMQKLLKKLWFDAPFSTTGFILDGFPRTPNDVEDMTITYCIPDLIIEIESNSEIALSRAAVSMFNTWEIHQKEAKRLATQKFNQEKKEWTNFVTGQVVGKVLCHEIVKELPISSPSPEEEEPLLVSSIESIEIDPDPSASQLQNIQMEIYEELMEENPEPIDETEWENAEEALDRINGRVEEIFSAEEENIQALKELILEQKINMVSVDGTKSQDRVFRQVLASLSFLRTRCESFFEQTFKIDNDFAEMLLEKGFYFLSRFQRLCPVYIYENPLSILNPYKVAKKANEIFPVIHRSNIYFIYGKESLMKFRTNPLIYVSCDNLLEHRPYPLRISVIGPPKSGKSSLAAKLANKYGLICISRGKAVRNVLEKMYWTKLANAITSTLNKGDCIATSHIIGAVQTVMLDYRPVTQGFVFDGFPDTPSEVMELSNKGIYPQIIFDLISSQEKILENSQGEIYYDILKMKPPYSRTMIQYKYTEWSHRCHEVRDNIHGNFQNIVKINGNNSKWRCSQDANDYINNTIIPKMHYYLNNVDKNIVSVDIMCISNEVFQQRMSCYKNLCPVCFIKNVLKHSDYPVDRKGLVQYNNLFYWICPDHMTAVMKRPDLYLNENEYIDIPEVPVIVKNIDVSFVYENGVCMVTYAENLPAQTIVTGSNKCAVNYKGKIYLFCSDKCMEKFLEKPHMYFDITIFKGTKIFPNIDLKTIPHIGYLEQTVGNILTEACCAVNVLRPKYPGIAPSLSALLYIGLYLKVRNPNLNKTYVPFYERALKVYEARSKLVIHVGLRLRSIDNPFAEYPKCCSETSSTRDGSNSLTLTRRVPVPDERFDYLCEYHKPASKVPAFLNVVDIAGLVRGAAEGQGLGNAFLSHIKACDAIFNLCRAFEDEDVIHVDGDVNPVRDLETIGEELRLKDEEQILQHLDKLDRVVNRGGDKKLKPEHDSLTKIKGILVDEKKHIRFGDWSAADIEVINKYLFLTSKPALYLVNLSEKDYIRKKNKWLPKLKEWIDKNDPGAPLIPFSGVFESKLMDMEPEERKAFLKENGVTSALDKIIVQGYKALQLEYFFTAGADEVKAWTIQKGTKAPQAAGRIHTDFEKGFIMAEVMHFKDFKEEGTEAACKAAGKYRQQGRNYVVEDGDVIFFKFNAGAGLKDAKKK